METIGERLKRLRIERGLSQRDCATPRASYAYISRIEAGTRTPSVKTIRELAAKLGVTPHYLETGQDHPLDDDDAVMRGYHAMQSMMQMRVGSKHDHAEAFRQALFNTPRRTTP